MTETEIEPIVPGSLRDTIRREIDGYLRDPLAFPPEFVSWIPQRVEQVGIVTPQSNVIGSYTTADSVSGLGTPIHGKTVMIRAGTAPYHFAQVTYDDVLGKWVSTVMVATTIDTFFANSTAGVFTDLSESSAFQRSQIPGFKALYDAGLRPQTHIVGRGVSSGGTTNSLRPSIHEFNSGDTALNKIAHGQQLDWPSVTTPQWRVGSGWSDVTFTSTPSEAEALLALQLAMGVAANFHNMSVLMRWVANRA